MSATIRHALTEIGIITAEKDSLNVAATKAAIATVSGVGTLGKPSVPSISSYNKKDEDSWASRYIIHDYQKSILKRSLQLTLQNII